MLQTTFYDTLRFSNENEATAKGEVYRAEYSGNEVRITDPDGKTTTLPLNYRPVAGLDVSDHMALHNFLDTDMERRDNEQKEGGKNGM